MSKQIKGLLYFYVTHTRHSFIIFWSILLGILILSLASSYFFKDTDSFMRISLTGPLYVYCGIYGFTVVKSWIPFFIKIGATRKNILISLGVFFLGVALVYGTIANILHSIVTMILNKIDVEVFQFLHLSYFFTDTWYTRMLIDVSIMLFCFTLLFIIALSFYKYGSAISGSVLGLVFVLFLFGIFEGTIADFIVRIFTDVSLLLFWQISFIAVILYVTSWFSMRRITIVKAR